MTTHRAECEFLTGAFAAAEERLSMLSSRGGRLDQIHRLRQRLKVHSNRLLTDLIHSQK